MFNHYIVLFFFFFFSVSFSFISCIYLSLHLSFGVSHSQNNNNNTTKFPFHGKLFFMLCAFDKCDMIKKNKRERNKREKKTKYNINTCIRAHTPEKIQILWFNFGWFCVLEMEWAQFRKNFKSVLNNNKKRMCQKRYRQRKNHHMLKCKQLSAFE